MPGNRPYIKVFFGILLLLVSHTGFAFGDPVVTGVFVSSRIRPYIEALDGLKTTANVELIVVYLDENLELAKHYLKKGEIEAAVAIGPEAAKLIYSPKFQVPIKMAIMTLDLKKLLPGNDPCGIDLRVPISFQVYQIAQRLGQGKTLAILYNPKENSDIIHQAQDACNQVGLRFTPLSVSGSDEIMRKLRPEIDQIDILLFIPDSTVISEKIVRHLTKAALIKGIAVVGYNHFFFETGAVMAFTIDYKNVGIEGAKLLAKFLQGEKCRLLPPPVKVEWNTKVFQFLREKHPERWNNIPGGHGRGN